MGLHPWGSMVRFIWGRGEFAWAKPVGLGNEAQDLQPMISQGSVPTSTQGPQTSNITGASKSWGPGGHHVLPEDQAASVPGRLQASGLKARPSLCTCTHGPQEKTDISLGGKTETFMVFQEAKTPACQPGKLQSQVVSG